jgi:hypothetical protein
MLAPAGIETSDWKYSERLVVCTWFCAFLLLETLYAIGNERYKITVLSVP